MRPTAPNPVLGRPTAANDHRHRRAEPCRTLLMGMLSATTTSSSLR
jgi:hypothetical protein